MARPVVFLAIGLVLATTVVVAVVAHSVAGLPWEVAFVLGAALGPTDPVAATSIIRRLGAPERVTAILEGESLVNDGTGLSALQVALGTVGAATFALGSSTLEFFGVVLGGIDGGRAGGLAGLAGPPSPGPAPRWRSRSQCSPATAPSWPPTACTSRGSWPRCWPGLVMGRRPPREIAPATRMRALAFWEPVQFFAESMLFLLIGLQFTQVVGAEDAPGLGELIGATLAVAAAAIAATRVALGSTVPFLAGLPEAMALALAPSPGPLLPPASSPCWPVGG